MCDLLKQFLAQDCDAYVRLTLLNEITRQMAANSVVVREFTFNRFNIVLNFGRQDVEIDDELDTGPGGSCSVTISEFSAALRDIAPI